MENEKNNRDLSYDDLLSVVRIQAQRLREVQKKYDDLKKTLGKWQEDYWELEREFRDYRNENPFEKP